MMISWSPWANTLALVPATGTKPGSFVELLMSNAKYRSVVAAALAWGLDAAAATPIAPLAASAAPAAMIAARRAGLCILTSCLLDPSDCHQTMTDGQQGSGPALKCPQGMPPRIDSGDQVGELLGCVPLEFMSVGAVDDEPGIVISGVCARQGGDRLGYLGSRVHAIDQP